MYLSPEQRNGEILSPPSDVYSFALIIKELIEKQLVLGSSINEEAAGTQNRNKETLNSLKAAIRGSFSENISDRLSASELLEKFTQISLKSENSSLLPVESGLNPDFFNQVPDQTELFDTVGKPNLKLRIKHTVLYLKARITRWVWLLLMGVLVTGMIIIINENDNEEVKRVGTIPTLHDGAKPHWDLAEQYDLIDFELGVKITGAGFPVYKNHGARLQRAMINFFLDKILKKCIVNKNEH